MKGWELLDIVDVGSSHCGYCGAALRWHFKLQKGDEQIAVGSECVKSFIDDADSAAAFRFFFDKWTQRRSYYWKRFAGLTWVLGQQRSGAWYVGVTQSVRMYPWLFLGPTFATDIAARHYLGRHLVTPCWVGTKIREVRKLQGKFNG